MNEWLEREELLIGSENIEKLNKSTVAVFGCGGVGSYALEALVRAGVGNIVLIDKDIVPTNQQYLLANPLLFFYLVLALVKILCVK